MEEKAINFLKQLLNCWYSDVMFLINISNNNNIELDIEDIRNNYWNIDINILIYETIRIISENFINEYKSQIHMVLWLWDHDNLENYRSYNDLYEIYTNYIDSHLWFKNELIQKMYENSQYYINK